LSGTSVVRGLTHARLSFHAPPDTTLAGMMGAVLVAGCSSMSTVPRETLSIPEKQSSAELPRHLNLMVA
jgi:hypothetical protein